MTKRECMWEEKMESVKTKKSSNAQGELGDAKGNEDEMRFDKTVVEKRH